MESSVREQGQQKAFSFLFHNELSVIHEQSHCEVVCVSQEVQKRPEIGDGGRKQNRSIWHHLPLDQINLLLKYFFKLARKCKIFERFSYIAILN